MLTPHLINEVMLEIGMLSDKSMVLGEESDLIRNGLMDSIGIIKIVLAVEKKFGISVAVEEILKDDFKTLRSIAEFFNRNIAVNPASLY